MTENVRTLSGKKLFPAKANILTCTVQTLDQPVLNTYLAMIICHVCSGNQYVHINQNPTPQHCPICNGYGHLFKMLRDSQV